MVQGLDSLGESARVNRFPLLGYLLAAFPRASKTGTIGSERYLFCDRFYRIWAKEYQRVRDLTGKTRIEAIEDLISEFQTLESWYASDEKTNPRKLKRLIEKSLDELRHHLPLDVYRFKKIATNPMPYTERFLPKTGDMRTIQQIADWRSDTKREQCWRKASACLDSLRDISRELSH